MEVQICHIINNYLSDYEGFPTVYLYSAPTNATDFITLLLISDINQQDKDTEADVPGKARMQLTYFTSNHTLSRRVLKKLQECIRTTQDVTQENVIWIFSRDNFSETIYNKETRRYQVVLDFSLDYFEAYTT